MHRGGDGAAGGTDDGVGEVFGVDFFDLDVRVGDGVAVADGVS